jgi:tRNA pseudouridine32 synthase/23S rRNA pseudouridine746 synthase
MTIARHPSSVTLPAAPLPWPSILEFLARQFPNIPRERWAERIRDGKVRDEHGAAITPATAYRPGRRLFYFREVDTEPVIPFAEQIVFQNDEILVACKPHFLPVTPGGRYVEECLLNRLRRRTGIDPLAPLHRIDRETAGLVVFSVNPQTRGVYHDLFMHGQAEKTYDALAPVRTPLQKRRWLVENRIERGQPRFRMQVVPGTPNARSIIELVDVHGEIGRFRLAPVTGKTHQLRVHMSGLGFPIVNDRCYPELLPEQEDDFERPLRLIAGRLRFRDPVTGQTMEFESERRLPFNMPAGGARPASTSR